MVPSSSVNGEGHRITKDFASCNQAREPQPMDFTPTICLMGMREQDAVDALGENLT
jgi:hypothetical protein